MPPYNFPVEEVTPTSVLKLAGETFTQTTSRARRKFNPGNPFADWPEEVLFIINRYPEIRLAMVEALQKEVQLGNVM